ncbi:hypothetical protein F9B85_08345 [Heliorestis acidaminivorans]|uniref:Uncharacterized protein n=1 Tax=Heliorestis acidaminivorans TaxID=553427 RepID=A0A6I0EZ24_9FIRM|nr:hypothetical protein [Heliorestis acidaminivorans]KAB2952652.1 hypothetical protein F9B85_08345 [Heliorestis acidaminivorans]
MSEPMTVRSFLDSMNRILEKESKESLKQMEITLKAELLPERNPVGPAYLWLVRDSEGRSMFWMVPEALAKKCKPRMVIIAKGHPVLWPSTKQGKRLEWLQVKEIEFPSTKELSRIEKARKLSQKGLVGWQRERKWPIDSSRGSVKIELIASKNNSFLPQLRHLFHKGRRFIITENHINMNEATEVAVAVEKASQRGGDFLLLLQQEDDNVLLFDEPVILQALKKTTLYTYLIQPQDRLRPFAYGWVDKWLESPVKASQELIGHCWQVWKGPKDKARLREAVTVQAEKDRTRLVGEISRLRRENEALQETVATLGPQKVTDLEDKLEVKDKELKKGEERRRIIDQQLLLVEQERDDLQRKLALLEAGGLVKEEPVDQDKEIEKIRRQEEFRRTLLEEERERLLAENKSLQKKVEASSPLLMEDIKKEKTALAQELDRSEERREQLAEFLFILEQENRELRGRLGFRTALDGEEAGSEELEQEEELVLGQARLYEEIYDILVQEEIERLQREVKRLQELLNTYSPIAMATLQEELEQVKERLIHSEELREKQRKKLDNLEKEMGKKDLLQKSLQEESKVREQENDTKSEESNSSEKEKVDPAEGMDTIIDKTFHLFRHGLRWNRKKD